MHFWGWIWPATLLWVILFYLRFKFFPRNGHPGWPIYKEKYTSLSFRCTTKRNIVVHTYAGCCQCQSHQFGWWQFSITKNWVWNVDPWHGQQVDPQRLITEKTGLICSTPLVTQQKSQLWNIPGAFKKYGKKGSDHIREILNPCRENPNYGKHGDRRAPKSDFFPIILSVTM